MLKEGNNATGNGRYVGFCVDLLRHVSMMAGFDYEIVLSGDGVYGLIDTETGEWNGLVRGLIDRKADLAVGSMTINYARESVIDFTKPFMNLGVSILFKNPHQHGGEFCPWLSANGNSLTSTQTISHDSGLSSS
nr:glutamate receptor ionotropic, kainate 2-like [Penaeus vannamei]